MKIVINEKVIANGLNSEWAEYICRLLNDRYGYSSESSETYFKVVDDAYQLQTFKEY